MIRCSEMRNIEHVAVIIEVNCHSIAIPKFIYQFQTSQLFAKQSMHRQLANEHQSTSTLRLIYKFRQKYVYIYICGNRFYEV